MEHPAAERGGAAESGSGAARAAAAAGACPASAGEQNSAKCEKSIFEWFCYFFSHFPDGFRTFRSICTVFDGPATSPAARERAAAGRRELLRPRERALPPREKRIRQNAKNRFFDENIDFRIFSHFSMVLYSFYSTGAPGQDLGSGSRSQECRQDSRNCREESRNLSANKKLSGSAAGTARTSDSRADL